MLKQRIITAVILIPLVIAAFRFLPTDILAILLGLVILLGAWEWAEIAGIKTPQSVVLYIFFNAFLMFLCFTQLDNIAFVRILLLLAIIGWLGAVFFVLRVQKSQLVPEQHTFKTLFIGSLIVVPAWFSLLILHAQEGMRGTWVFFLFGLIWAADTGAYFAGRRFGRHKLADKISPGKSWEGVLGALIASSLVALIGCFILGISQPTSSLLIALSLGVVSISIVGDLIESLFKRIAGVKDSSQLLPGHGGIMDRIDSLTSAAPFFAASLLILGLAEA